jgi:hypothetical protein
MRQVISLCSGKKHRRKVIVPVKQNLEKGLSMALTVLAHEGYTVSVYCPEPEFPGVEISLRRGERLNITARGNTTIEALLPVLDRVEEVLAQGLCSIHDCMTYLREE